MGITRFKGPIKITETGTSTNAGNQTIAGTLAVTGVITATAGVTGTLTGDQIIPTATVAATGTTNADAAAVTYGFTLVTAADDAKGVKLPAAAAGRICIIKNNVSAKILKIYPGASDGINALTVTTGSLDIAGLTSVMLIAYDATTWYSLPLLPS